MECRRVLPPPRVCVCVCVCVHAYLPVFLEQVYRHGWAGGTGTARLGLAFKTRLGRLLQRGEALFLRLLLNEELLQCGKCVRRQCGRFVVDQVRHGKKTTTKTRTTLAKWTRQKKKRKVGRRVVI